MNGPRVLLTGFTPFSSHTTNISEDVLREISISGIEGLETTTMLLPVDEDGSKMPTTEILNGPDYSAILLLGYSAGIDKIHLERFGRNQYEMIIPDNSGRQIKMGVIVNDAPTAIKTNAPAHVIDEELDDNDNIIWSEDAGGFVCNETYFRTLLAAGMSEESKPVVLFMHLPDEGIISKEEQIFVVKKVTNCLCIRPHYAVVAGLIIDADGRILACKRPAGDEWSGWWELPGGKIADNESPQDALVRELLEELRISILPSHIITEIHHSYEDKDVNLQIWHCGIIEPKEISPTEHDDTRWLSREELLRVKWLPADLPVIESWHENGIPIH